MKDHQNTKKKNRLLLIWHRRLGITAAIFVVLLAISGILLNHSSVLGFDKQPIKSKLLLSWYGIKPSEQPLHFNVNDAIVSQLENQIYLNGRPLWQSRNTMLGAAASESLIGLAFENELVLFTHSGQLLEKISDLPGLQSPVTAIGKDVSGRIVLNGGNQVFMADEQLVHWLPVPDSDSITWSNPMTGDNQYNDIIVSQYLPPDLTQERFLLDLHSGRLFGISAVYLMDVAALAMILLAITGVWRWILTRQKRYRDNSSGI